MTAPPRHPSFLELDRAALGLRSAELDQHVETCARCGAYLARVMNRSEPIPAWARTPPAPDTRVGGWRGWLPRAWPVLATAAVAAVLALVVVVPKSPVQDGPAYIAPKGIPAVAVYIKRGEQVFVWDGQASLVPEDLIRLKVASQEHAYVTVAAGAPAWTVLFAGPLSAEPETALPTSWRVDAAGSEEVLRVIFSTEPLPADETVRLFSEAPRTEKLWTTELRLPKSTSP
ncbi:hypothetical protein HPC49_25415 [Pyxidicoccus fallax]|uniref:Uncharacterized protein n=1 Tax=Pyxidicoccus fallax TaxID=394095 RepID=A0A848LIJ1_9BACT|nr:hypothetical protein [Pyxidicoccus fallax]NMO17534.1 hypothetical protein [Pyxidicoccus fallax]NPC81551.1 hypothetical protein [Pyxidicoccus fallax]